MTAPPPPQVIGGPRLRIGLQIAVLVYLVLAFGAIGVNWRRVTEGMERGQGFIMGFLQPDFTSRWHDISQGPVERLTMTLTSKRCDDRFVIALVARDQAAGFLHCSKRAGRFDLASFEGAAGQAKQHQSFMQRCIRDGTQSLWP